MAWILTSHAALFAVAHKDKPDTALIRARVLEDIQWLCKETGAEYWEDDDADYIYRVELPREVWAQFLYDDAMDMDYTSLKKGVLANQGSERYALYSRVWSILMEMQPYGKGFYNRPLPARTTRDVQASTGRLTKKQRKRLQRQARAAELDWANGGGAPVDIDWECVKCEGDIRYCSCAFFNVASSS